MGAASLSIEPQACLKSTEGDGFSLHVKREMRAKKRMTQLIFHPLFKLFCPKRDRVGEHEIPNA